MGFGGGGVQWTQDRADRADNSRLRSVQVRGKAFRVSSFQGHEENTEELDSTSGRKLQIDIKHEPKHLPIHRSLALLSKTLRNLEQSPYTRPVRRTSLGISFRRTSRTSSKQLVTSDEDRLVDSTVNLPPETY